jgi:hypothetical protein
MVCARECTIFSRLFRSTPEPGRYHRFSNSILMATVFVKPPMKPPRRTLLTRTIWGYRKLRRKETAKSTNTTDTRRAPIREASHRPFMNAGSACMRQRCEGFS